MNLPIALRVTVILGWAGLLVEMTRTAPWPAAVLATAILICCLARNR